MVHRLVDVSQQCAELQCPHLQEPLIGWMVPYSVQNCSAFTSRNHSSGGWFHTVCKTAVPSPSGTTHRVDGSIQCAKLQCLHLQESLIGWMVPYSVQNCSAFTFRNHSSGGWFPTVCRTAVPSPPRTTHQVDGSKQCAELQCLHLQEPLIRWMVPNSVQNCSAFTFSNYSSGGWFQTVCRTAVPSPPGTTHQVDVSQQCAKLQYLQHQEPLTQ